MKKNAPDTVVLTARELARHYKIGVDTVWKLVQAGRIPFIQVSPRVRRFDLDEVRRALRRQSESGEGRG